MKSTPSQSEGDAEGVTGANIPEVGGKEEETVDLDDQVEYLELADSGERRNHWWDEGTTWMLQRDLGQELLDSAIQSGN